MIVPRDHLNGPLIVHFLEDKIVPTAGRKQRGASHHLAVATRLFSIGVRGPRRAMDATSKSLLQVTLQGLLGPNVSAAEDYEKLRAIGQGAHGTTRLVRRKHDGRLLCSKHVVAERFPKVATHVLREVEILMMLDGHPHVIGFISAYLSDDGLDIVQEFAEGGTLQHRLDRRRDLNEPLLEGEVLDTFVQLVSALQHLHSHGVMHRDLKPSNIFFDRRNLARLGDFGIAALQKCAARIVTPACHSSMPSRRRAPRLRA